ncbi:serine hydrolase domain-containing protein [Pacificibacter sp.]|uniref:serine hydrolase domain-containing protein n=1 Tax=Pacificibacter sp. TaxID=1917866 RepID=UPI00321980B2
MNNSTSKHLTAMMWPYASPQHSVVAFHLSHGKTTFIHSGPAVSDAPCADWLFEIASITKVFTALLLCVLVEEGKIDPKAPEREMSEALKDVPEWITPERLTSHASGLPNYVTPLWKAVLRQDSAGPYAQFSRSDLLAWFHERANKLTPPSHRHVYSNLGVGLLGEAMAMQEGQPFAELLAEKVTGPMGLQDTTQYLNEGQKNRFAQPRSPNGKPVPAWHFQSLAGAGCLRSSARDLACFAKVVLRALNHQQTTSETALDRAICRSVVPILGLGRKGAMTPMAQCSGWFRVHVDRTAPDFLWHNGGTAGSCCALHICPERNAAFGILSNNGVAGNLWASTKLNWSKPMQKAHRLFAEM